MNDNRTALSDDPLWFKDAIVYQLHVKAYKDSNGDGIGDFKGLIEQLDYVQELGVNTIWMLPFYPSPQRDDGYDIADYLDVHPNFGTLQDFRDFVSEAHKRGLRVITELVINHTSDQHPWFQAARKAPKDSPERQMYVWSDTDTKFADTRIIFTDSEPSNWTWDPIAKQYFWHRFFHHQPDLNHNNPEVVKAVVKILDYWLEMGVDGVRLDAIPYLCVREGTTNENLPETHAVIRQLRAAMDERFKNRMLLAEANQWPEDVSEYFGNGDECQMAYHFPLMPRMYMAVAMEDRHPVVEIMAQTPEIPESCQWAIFLRNHDELTLEMVTDRERDYMYDVYATDSRMRVNVGIRRRLAPLMGNDADKIKLMNGMLMSMPGSPIVYYGDEIGMGDNIFLGDRNGVRTPMQWSPDRNAGFSRCDPQRLYLPCIMDPIYGYEGMNVEAQSRQPGSMLNWMKRLIATRTSTRAFSRGAQTFIRPGNRKILAFVREYDGEIILCVFNLSRSPQPVELDLARYRHLVPVEMFGRTPFPPIGEMPYMLTLPGYGFYWFRLAAGAETPAWHDDRPILSEHAVLVLFDELNSFFPERAEASRQPMSQKITQRLEQEILGPFLAGQPWFRGSRTARFELHFIRDGIWSTDLGQWILAVPEVRHENDGAERCFLPLAIAWETRDNEEHLRSLLPATIAKVRQQSRVGILYDAVSDEQFCRALLKGILDGGTQEFDGGVRLQFARLGSAGDLAGEGSESLTVGIPEPSGAHTGIVFGDRLYLRVHRALSDGMGPALEVNRHLCETASLSCIPPLIGAIERQDPGGQNAALAILQGYVPNQGTGWSYVTDYLHRTFERWLLRAPDGDDEGDEEPHAYNLMMIHRLGARTAELHMALAKTTGDAAFDPESMDGSELTSGVEQAREIAATVMSALANRAAVYADRIEQVIDELTSRRDRVTESLDPSLAGVTGMVKTRIHGDYRLQRILVAENDFVITGFNGNPAFPIEVRRQKSTPLHDLASMICSLHEASRSVLANLSDMKYAGDNRLATMVREWEDRASESFLDGYVAKADEGAVWPADNSAGRRLVRSLAIQVALRRLHDSLASPAPAPDVAVRTVLALLDGR